MNENLVGVERAKAEVYLNKPMASGVTVLDLSKLHMYNFFYNVMKPKYADTCRLLVTDTDSLVLDVATEDVYADFHVEGMGKHFDFNDYPKRSPQL